MLIDDCKGVDQTRPAWALMSDCVSTLHTLRGRTELLGSGLGALTAKEDLSGDERRAHPAGGRLRADGDA